MCQNKSVDKGTVSHMPDYQRIFYENQNSSLKTLIAMYQGKYIQLALSVLFFIIKHSPVWIMPVVTANVINAITEGGEDAPRIIFFNVAVMFVTVLQNVPTNYIHTYFYAKAIRRVEMELRSALVRKLQQLSISFHQKMESGRIQSKIMRDVEQIETLSSQIFISMISIVLNVVIAGVVVIINSRVVFLFFLATIPLAVVVIVHFRGKIRGYNREFRREMEETSVQVMEMVEMIPVTRAHALEERETEKMERRLVQVADKGFRLDMIQTYFGSVSWIVFQIFQVLCLTFTSFMALKGRISIGDVTMYQSYFSTIVNGITGIVGLIPIIAKGLESVESVGDILLSEEVEELRGGRTRIPVKGEIRFEHVGFCYAGGEEDVFSDISFAVKPGETIAFVGSSGAGKTTILNLVIGFAKATRGRILIDGVDMPELDIHHYREHIAVVPQTSILFSGTIRENITYGLDDVSEEELMEAIRASNLTELLEKLPEGLDTRISEHGSNLSGGQRQRISIARAFVRNPRILILDEATSALDTISERQIQEATENLAKTRTTLIVAHRLSTIRNADKIAVIDHGGLQEFGTYEELTERKGAFYRLREMQI